MPIKKSVRIIKKVRDEDGQRRFVSLHHVGARYVWDKRPGHYLVEWWEAETSNWGKQHIEAKPQGLAAAALNL
ncbi:MAG: hypothetical protein ABR906_09755 [Terracidiphilus sp.]